MHRVVSVYFDPDVFLRYMKMCSSMNFEDGGDLQLLRSMFRELFVQMVCF